MRIRLHWMTNRTALTSADQSCRWQRGVAGPVTATIACLTEIGWKPHAPDLWYDQHGNKWSMEDLTEKHMPIKSMELLQTIERDALRYVESRSDQFS